MDWFLAQRPQHQIPMSRFDPSVQPHIPIMLPTDTIPSISAPSDPLETNIANQVKPVEEAPTKNGDTEYYGQELRHILYVVYQ